MICARIQARSLVFVLACACGPVAGEDAGPGSGSGEGSTTSGTSGMSTMETTNGPTSTTAVSSTTTGTTDDTASADDTSTGEPPSVCDPQPMMGVVSSVLFDAGALPPEPLANPYAYTCIIDDWLEGEALLTLALACEDGDHVLAIGSSVGIWFDSRGEFVVTVIHSAQTWGAEDQLVTLRRADGSLVLAGASTPWPPDFEQVPSDFFAPLSIGLLPDVCEVEPPYEGGFVPPCFRIQRQALRFELAGETVDVYEHGADQLSPYVLLVERAELRHDVTCTDTQGRWYSWVAVPPIPD
ncbi:hypothetical protein [Paraliomyxa miuraensis]|uniref:hypothetical protein n=1 Tax=Paraliomyxa miuraensis TaxID=376150 RepID=UPI002251380D|nr:hypothetical protein [Paraliomyxa miuraensis]MCX4244716.1 hypothetical protein [Paraliomyxa miuraensis]